MARIPHKKWAIVLLVVVAAVTLACAVLWLRSVRNAHARNYDLSSPERAIEAFACALQSGDTTTIQCVCTAEGWETLQMCLGDVSGDAEFAEECRNLGEGISIATWRHWMKEDDDRWVLDYGDEEFYFLRLYVVTTPEGWKVGAVVPSW